MTNGPTLRLAYLIAQYPAINHGYLLSEVRLLRALGVEVEVASVRPPDRPADRLNDEERAEAERVFYIKQVRLTELGRALLAMLLRHPVRFARALLFAWSLGRGRSRLRHLVYFAQAALLGQWMARRGLAHVHTSFSATVSLIATRCFPITMSFGVYGFGELHDPAGTHLAAKIRAASFVRSNSIYGCGQMMLSCERSQWRKLKYVPLGIDPARYAPRPFREAPSPFSIICVGRLAPEKGQCFLLQAAARLIQEQRPVRIVLVGDGPDRRALEEDCQRRGLDGAVSFEGWVDDTRLIALYNEADAFVLPSLAEGIPTVLIEAMSMEIPCVAPCIAGIPELIKDGHSGLLFPVSDVERLTDAIRMLVTLPEERRNLGRRGRERALREYDIAANTQRLAAVFREHVSAGRR